MGKADGGLRKLIQENLPEFDWTPIETGGLVPGVPDLNGCLSGVEFWIECKRTKTLAVKFEDFQPQWIHRRSRAGGRVWVAVRRFHDGGPRRGPPVDEFWLISGANILVVEREGIRGWATVFCEGGPAKWDWARIGRTLAAPQ